MINKEIDQITEEDLQALKDNSVPEGKTVEYKESLPGNSDSDKKESLADVSSFANASGGDLIFGIIENKKTGTPKSLEGLSIENVDQEIQRLENMIRDGIAPRILAISTKQIPLSNSKVALLIRIPKSWNAPHRVILGGHDKFYSRSSNGKYPLDVGELRIAFNLSETITERIRNFRLDRLSKILANEIPVTLYDNPKIVLHLIPIISFNPAQSYNVDKIASHPEIMGPINCGAWDNRYNLDGFLTYSRVEEGKTRSYVQLFRNGIIEAVEGWLLRARGERPSIPSISYEERLISSLPVYLSTLKELNIEPPIFIFLTLVGVRGYSMGVDTWRYDIDEVCTIDRDILSLPEVVIDNYDVSAEKVLKPCFDATWNACGFPGSLYYNEQGEWSPK